jgi:hypothetical protein
MLKTSSTLSTVPIRASHVLAPSKHTIDTRLAELALEEGTYCHESHTSDSIDPIYTVHVSPIRNHPMHATPSDN